jgi:hypothetical protein
MVTKYIGSLVLVFRTPLREAETIEANSMATERICIGQNKECM